MQHLNKIVHDECGCQPFNNCAETEDSYMTGKRADTNRSIVQGPIAGCATMSPHPKHMEFNGAWRVELRKLARGRRDATCRQDAKQLISPTVRSCLAAEY